MTKNRRALLKPFQLIGLSAGLGIFTMLIILMTTRKWDFALIGAGAVFVVVIVVLAMLVLSYKPNPEAPVYLDRNLAESKEPGAKSAAMRADVEAAVGGDAPREKSTDEAEDAPDGPATQA